jgi:hypothetical protein
LAGIFWSAAQEYSRHSQPQQGDEMTIDWNNVRLTALTTAAG